MTRRNNSRIKLWAVIAHVVFVQLLFATSLAHGQIIDERDATLFVGDESNDQWVWDEAGERVFALNTEANTLVQYSMDGRQAKIYPIGQNPKQLLATTQHLVAHCDKSLYVWELSDFQDAKIVKLDRPANSIMFPSEDGKRLVYYASKNQETNSNQRNDLVRGGGAFGGGARFGLSGEGSIAARKRREREVEQNKHFFLCEVDLQRAKLLKVVENGGTPCKVAFGSERLFGYRVDDNCPQRLRTSIPLLEKTIDPGKSQTRSGYGGGLSRRSSSHETNFSRLPIVSSDLRYWCVNGIRDVFANSNIPASGLDRAAIHPKYDLVAYTKSGGVGLVETSTNNSRKLGFVTSKDLHRSLPRRYNATFIRFSTKLNLAFFTFKGYAIIVSFDHLLGEIKERVILEPIESRTVPVGRPIRIPIHWSGGGAGPELKLRTKLSGMVLQGNEIRWTPQENQQGLHQVQILAGGDRLVRESFDVTVTNAKEVELGFPVRQIRISDQSNVAICWGRRDKVSQTEVIASIDLKSGKKLSQREVPIGIVDAQTDGWNCFIRSSANDRVAKYDLRKLDKDPVLISLSQPSAALESIPAFYQTLLRNEKATRISSELWTDGYTVREFKTGQVVAIRDENALPILLGSVAPQRHFDLFERKPQVSLKDSDDRLLSRTWDDNHATHFTFGSRRHKRETNKYEYWLSGFDWGGSRLIGQQFVCAMGPDIGHPDWPRANFPKSSLVESSQSHVVVTFRLSAWLVSKLGFKRSQNNALQLSWPKLKVLRYGQRYKIPLKVGGGVGDYSFRVVGDPEGIEINRKTGLMQINTGAISEDRMRPQGHFKFRDYRRKMEEEWAHFREETGLKFPANHFPLLMPVDVEVTDAKKQIAKVNFCLLIARSFDEKPKQAISKPASNNRSDRSEEDQNTLRRVEKVERELESLLEKLSAIENLLEPQNADRNDSRGDE